MNTEQAKKIIIEAFENEFNKNSFVKFLRNLLKSYDEQSTFEYRGNYIPDSFADYVRSFQRLGKYTSNNKEEIDLLIVELSRETSVERARSIQRNFVAWYLKGSRGGKLKDAALVAFFSPDSEDWRFSLVKVDYRYQETSSGKIKVVEETTPARRWSFLVGKNEKSHTAQSRFIHILENDDLKPTLGDLEKAFDIEVVTKEFFQKYRDLFIKTKRELDKILQEGRKVRLEFEKKKINTVDFAKKLLGQIVFLYFMQKKGWFGVPRGSKWGTGPKDFIRKLFNGYYIKYKNFYNDVLEPLFYEALRIDRSSNDHYYSRFRCRIPFLNGGLFDPINNFDWVNVDILLPNELFSNSERTKEGDIGNGILDIFDRYNFTVNEEEPLEKEVALDPELLGKIYEKLNAIRPDNFDEYVEIVESKKTGEEMKFNREYGVYYTPREIVNYMCQESLINYLSSELGDTVPKNDIEKFVKIADLILEKEIAVANKQERIRMGEQKTTAYASSIPESIKNNARKIDKLLEDIKVCDPAVGSGVFPIGMMHEVVKLRRLLSVYLRNSFSTYDLKRHCIENSLYGVDIDPSAVEICKLRFWLSLVVDEDDFHNIKPLPNLDYKVVCGDSLLGIDKNLFNKQLFSELEKLKPEYFNETDPNKKQNLKNDIDKLIFLITNGKREFDFNVYFSEVFHRKGGFDVVLGNPPYGDIMDKFQKDFVSKNYKFSLTSDISIPFVERGVEILKRGGYLTYIITFAITFNKDFSKVRSLLRNSFREVYIYSFDRDKCRIFESMTQSVSILKALCKGSEEKLGIYTSRMFRDTPDIYNIEVSSADEFLLPINTNYSYPHRLPKLGESINVQILRKILKLPSKVRDIISKSGKDIWIRTSGNYWYNAWYKEPYKSSKIKNIKIKREYSDFLILLMNSSLFYFWLRIFGDGRDMNFDIFEELPVPSKELVDSNRYFLKLLAEKFMIFLFNVFDKDHKRFMTSEIKDKIDIIDLVLGKNFYGLSYEEILHIMDYDKEVRGGCKLIEYQNYVSQITSTVRSADNFSASYTRNKVSELERKIEQLIYRVYKLTKEEIRSMKGI